MPKYRVVFSFQVFNYVDVDALDPDTALDKADPDNAQYYGDTESSVFSVERIDD